MKTIIVGIGALILGLVVGSAALAPAKPTVREKCEAAAREYVEFAFGEGGRYQLYQNDANRNHIYMQKVDSCLEWQMRRPLP
jgi:hypothetical protein